MSQNKSLQKIRIFFVLILFLIIISSFAHAKTDDELLDELEYRGKVRAVVILSEEKVSGNPKQIAIAQKNNKALRNKVMSEIGKEKVLHEFNSKNAFSAMLSREDLENLEKNSDVEMIIKATKLKIQLQDSTTIINATDAWNFAPYGTNLTGQGRTVCVLDSGINYAHSDFGGCNITALELDGNQENYTLESLHNYSNNEVVNWTIIMPGFESIAVHFINMSVENYYDYIKILDGNNNVVAEYTGVHQDLWSPSVSGDNITIVIESDELINDYGFYADKVINGTTNSSYTWDNCSKIVYGWDLNNIDPDPYDDNGHGTHVSGIVAANGVIRGVAPDANLVSIKVTDAAGDTDSLRISEGIEMCTNISQLYNIGVISISIGSDSTYSDYCDSLDYLTTSAINTAVKKNISVVLSTGNGGRSQSISFPACIKNATRVGATTKSDIIAGYSNLWNKSMLLAPGGDAGADINSTSYNGGYELMSGTSMAAPHVAGAIAILQQYWLEQNGSIADSQLILDALNSTGTQIDGGLSRNYSRINIISALDYLNQTGDIANNPVEFNSSKSIPDFEWDQRERLEDAFDLSDYFFDADEDNLSFTLEGTSDIDMFLSGTMVSFEAPDDFYGEETVWIEANDSESTAQSNTFVLTINRRRTGGGGGGGSYIRPQNTTQNTTEENISNINNVSYEYNLSINISKNASINFEINESNNNGEENNVSLIEGSNSSNPAEELMGKKNNISLKIHQEENNTINTSKKVKMTPEQAQLLVKALAGVLSVVAILLVIALINKLAKKKAEKMNAEITEALKAHKAEGKNKKEKKNKK